MQTKVVKLDPRDNLIIALTDLHSGEEASCLRRNLHARHRRSREA